MRWISAAIDLLGISSMLDRVQFRGYFSSLNRVRNPSGRPSKRRKCAEPLEIPFTGREKKGLEVGDLAFKFGGLLNRESAKQDLCSGLEYLATKVGKKNLDRNNVPVLGLAAPSGAGKTEFLKWIFNDCCTCMPADGKSDSAIELLQKINKAIPQGEERLDNILVLFATFNQESTYTRGEGPIEETTVERLRSFQGNLIMGTGSTS